MGPTKHPTTTPMSAINNMQTLIAIFCFLRLSLVQQRISRQKTLNSPQDQNRIKMYLICNTKESLIQTHCQYHNNSQVSTSQRSQTNTPSGA